MRRIFLVISATVALAACGGNTNSDHSLPVQTKTATDTMTNITNPGVGSAADDTSARP